MKFKNVLHSRATIKKQKEYKFLELTEQDIIEGKTNA